MKLKNIFKGPIIWIVLVLAILLIVVPNLAGPQASRVDTSVGLQLLTDDKVEQARINDGNQSVELTLREDFIQDGANEGKSITFFYSTARAEDVVDAISASNVDVFTDQPVENNWFTGFISLILPILIIGIIFWFLLSRMQGGGSKVMQFGKSKAKLITKDMPQVTFADVAGADEAVEELHEIKEFLQEPGKFQALGAKIPKGVLLYGPPGTARPCWPARLPVKPACPSTPSPARTSSKCSSVWAPPVSATCSSRRRTTRRRSSSSTRSTPLAATAAPAWAAATTSVSRR